MQRGLGNDARLVMVMHPVLESRFRAAVDMLGGLDFMRAKPRVIRVIEETFEEVRLSLWRYRDRLPVDPLVTLGEGDTPLIHAGRAVGAHRLRRLAEVRGLEPHRLVQGPGDDRGGVGGHRARAPRP